MTADGKEKARPPAAWRNHQPDQPEPAISAWDSFRPQPIADTPVISDFGGISSAERESEAEEEQPHFRPEVDWFESVLWREASDDMRVYAIMDGYWAKGLYGRLLASPDISWAHMFQGDVALHNIQKAPFIIALKRGHKLLRWLVEEGWGDGWGSYFLASTDAALKSYGPTRRLPPDMAESNEERVKLCSLTEGISDPLWLMRNHFRRFSDVELEDNGHIVDFRYYDPATLRTYLTSCNERELKRFFGPVDSFIAENYSEAASLNRSQQVFMFRKFFAPPTAANAYGLKGATRLEAFLFDFVASEYLPFTPPPISTGQDREPGVHVMIRSEQIEAFRALSLHNFAGHVAERIEGILKALCLQWTTSDKMNFIETNLSVAQGYGMKTEREIYGFLCCVVALTETEFASKWRLAALLERHERQDVFDVGYELEHLSYKIAYERASA